MINHNIIDISMSFFENNWKYLASGVISFASSWFLIWYKINKQSKINIIEANVKHELEKQVEQQNQKLIALHNLYLKNQDIVYNKKISAIETTWKTLNNILNTVPIPISSCIYYFSTTDFSYEVIKKSKIPQLVKDNQDKINKYIYSYTDNSNNIRDLRPFLGDKIYNLCNVYMMVILWFTYNIDEGLKSQKIKPWTDFENIKTGIENNLSEEELKIFYNKKDGAFSFFLETIKYKILKEMSQILESKDIQKNIPNFEFHPKEELGL